MPLMEEIMMRRYPKPWGVADFILTVALIVASIALASATFYNDVLAWPEWHFEFAVYKLAGICFLRFYCRRFLGTRSKAVAIGGAAGLATVFTVLVCLYNNLLHFLDWNFGTLHFYLAQKEAIPYVYFLRKDITYHIGTGGLRYPLVFLLMLLAELGIYVGPRVVVTLRDCRKHNQI